MDATIAEASSAPIATYIDRLPPEILTEVFLNIRGNALYFYWIGMVTGVCGYWRRVALESASLWAKFRIQPGSKPEIITTFLCRSKHADLDVTIGRQGARMDLCAALGLLAEHKGRIRVLSLLYGVDQIHCVEGFVATLGHRFTTLHLTDHGFVLPRRSLLSVPRRYISLTSAHLPALRELRVDGVVVDASPALLSNLTTFELRRLQDFVLDAAGPPFADYVFQTLSACPGLGRLVLEDVLWRTTDVGGSRTISLPKLRQLHVRVEDTPTAYILPLFSIPATTTIDSISVWSGSRWFDWVHDKSRVGIFKTALPLPGRDEGAMRRYSSTRSLSLRAYNQYQPDMLAYTYLDIGGVAGDTLTPWTARVDLRHYSRNTKSRASLFAAAIHDVPALVNSLQIIQLEIHAVPHLLAVTSWPWTSIMRQFQRVETLTVGGACAVTAFILTLSKEKSCLPALKSLTLCLYDVTRMIKDAFEACAKMHEKTGRNVLPPSLLLRLPSKLHENGADRKRLNGWVFGLSTFVRIRLEFETCTYCTSMVFEDRLQILEEDEASKKASKATSMASRKAPFKFSLL
ncbi:hypothetical protein C8Q79DRAFT_631586 [Trametes meyenii]|nr:hypothetical protein C8Q79DRAFT_631586 [Trametes meyenii]